MDCVEYPGDGEGEDANAKQVAVVEIPVHGALRRAGGVAFWTVESSTVLARDKSGEEEALPCRGGREAIIIMRLELTDLWKHVVDRAKHELGSATLDMLLENARPVRLESGKLTIHFPTRWERDWVEARHLADLRSMCQEIVPGITAIEMLTASENGRHKAVSGEPDPDYPNGVPARPDTLPTHRQRGPRVTGSTLNPRYTFDSFVVGPSNRFAQAASLAVAEDPAGAYNPLFLYGGVGLGKTHLMQAIAHYVRQHHPRMYVVYVSSETFTNDLINALGKRSMAEFRQKYRNVDLLLIDDIQFVAGKEQTQEEFFHTFNALYEAEKQIVISSDRPPKEIPTLEERLRSRFEWGLTTDIQPPDLETRVAILRKKAADEGISLPNDTYLYIANVMQSNIRELEGALIRVVAYASLQNLPLTPEVAEEALRDIVSATQSRVITIELIQSVVASHFGINVSDMKAKKRTRSLVFPRQVAMYLARELTDSSLPQIGEEFGGRDHSTVIHAYEKVKAEAQSDPALSQTLRELAQKIQNG